MEPVETLSQFITDTLQLRPKYDGQKIIEKSASTLKGVRLDLERAKSIPFPTTQDLERTFKMDLDDKGNAVIVEIKHEFPT